MRIVLAIILLLLSAGVFAQSNSLRGEILNENGVPMTSTTVVLLDPADSTMQYFAISGTTGKFEIKNIKSGDYLMQVAFIGYETIYSRISIPYNDNGDLGPIPMLPKPVELDEVTVTGERVPLKIKQDTIEYDAKAFKVKTDAVAEDLLKKLPGIEVDRAGNIKALGEDVKNVLVDGKEFFSGDTKVATKNIPADALDKVQVYNKKTEEAEFTGIEDGVRNQTINLQLDEDKKDGVFGELMGGYGTANHYQANAKVYRFSDKTQIAALGMMNNINKYGFSIGDYMSFSGGIAKIAHGEGGSFSLGGGGFPINFGETVPGFATNGAAGINLSYSTSKYNRYFISYLGNGSKRELNESSQTTNYRELDSFTQNDQTEQVQRDTAHNISFGIRHRFRETNNIVVNGGISYNTGYVPLSSSVSSYLNDILLNSMIRESYDLSDRLSGNVSGSYLKRINKGKTIIKLNGSSIYSSSSSETSFENNTTYFNPEFNELVKQFQNNTIKNFNYRGTFSFTQNLAPMYYMDLFVSASNSDETMVREQGNSLNGRALIDTLSPDFKKKDFSIKPGITIRRTNKKATLSLGLDYNLGHYGTSLWGDGPDERKYAFLQPRFSWQWEYKTGRRLMIDYSASSKTPSVNQLLPVVNNFNSLSLFYGNRELNPEYTHSASTHWWIFDQFSFTSLFTSLRASYTRDKINYSRTVNDQLAQIVQLINVDYNYNLSGSLDFSTPIRPLGIKTNFSFDESINRGLNIVNGTDNEITSFTHRFSLTFDNRKKEKWDISTGTGLTITDASYSIQKSLNNIYYDLSWFGELRWTPNEDFDFNVSADVTNYTAKSFEESQIIPLIGAQISYFFLANNRASLTLSGFDLLNRNTGISRTSELNFLRESRSNIIGRYVMLSFKYRLNKFGKDSGIHVDVKKR